MKTMYILPNKLWDEVKLGAYIPKILLQIRCSVAFVFLFTCKDPVQCLWAALCFAFFCIVFSFCSFFLLVFFLGGLSSCKPVLFYAESNNTALSPEGLFSPFFFLLLNIANTCDKIKVKTLCLYVQIINDRFLSGCSGSYFEKWMEILAGLRFEPSHIRTILETSSESANAGPTLYLIYVPSVADIVQKCRKNPWPCSKWFPAVSFALIQHEKKTQPNSKWSRAMIKVGEKQYIHAWPLFQVSSSCLEWKK